MTPSHKKRGGKLCYKPIIVGYTKSHQPIKVSCRKCDECLQTRANDWGLRCHFEIKNHQENCFITLTYDKNPVLLHKEHMQKFIKRLRKKIYPKKIKYFSCGEYGDKQLRPHYHLIIFGHDFNDKIYWKNSQSGKRIYLSKELTNLWGYGNTTTQYANAQTARYSARYAAKSKENLPWPQNKQPEFNTMSQNLGVKEILAHIDNYLETDQIYVDGYAYKIPQVILNKYITETFTEGTGEATKETLKRYKIVKKIKQKRKYSKIIYNKKQINQTKERLAKKQKLHQALREL